MEIFEPVNQKILHLIQIWEPKLCSLDADILKDRKNKQDRSIKQIVGHMVDSASNNIHRIVHLQYQQSPLIFPDYAHFGNNDKWIAIQKFQEEDWSDLVQLWKFSLLHIVHVIRHINPEKLDNIWLSALNENISLRDMVLSFPKHLELHLREVEELL